MTFVFGYRMIFNLFKLEQIYNLILCIVIDKYYSSKNDRVMPWNATVTDCRPTQHGTVSKGHK